MTIGCDHRRSGCAASALHARLVLAARGRRGGPGDDTLRYGERVTRKACSDFEASLREFSGEPGHVHPPGNYPPKVPVSALVNSLKGVPARMLRSEHTGQVNHARMNGHLWSPSYLAASCGGAPLSITRQYIQQQRPRLTPP
jgi:putative transposase